MTKKVLQRQKLAKKDGPRKMVAKVISKHRAKVPQKATIKAQTTKKKKSTSSRRTHVKISHLKLLINELQQDPKLSTIIKATRLVSCYLKSEALTNRLLKEVIRLWAEAGEKIRVICLVCLIRIYTRLHDQERKLRLLKKLLAIFTEKSRITKIGTISLIGFMRHSLVELFKIDNSISSSLAHKSCQQLTLSLKNAAKQKSESQKNVLNWQFANSLTLLTSFVASCEDEPLTHQVIQLNLGALALQSSPTYYPYYCHLLENLVNLSISKTHFIPILPMLLAILDKLQLPVKKDANEGEEFDIDLLNHVSLAEVHHPKYILAVADKIHQLMVKLLASQCHKIAFPELVLFPCVQLKKWIKKNSTPEAQKFKTLLEKIKSDSDKIAEERKSSTFAFTDYAAVDAWEKKMKDSNKLSLNK